jgi:penicillin-insensitive murein DD-endopeptidase
VSGDDAAGRKLANWYAMLKKSAIATAKRPPAGAKKGPRKSTLTVADLPRECGTVLTAGGFEPVPADVDIMPRTMLKAVA